MGKINTQFYILIGLVGLFLTGCSRVPSITEIDVNNWDINGIKIYHFEQGAGTPILMIHGGPGYPYSKPIRELDPLAEKYQFVYFDQRGCGRSTHPFERFPNGKKGKHIWKLMSTLGYKNHISDIEAIRKHLQQEKIILFGHSFGAVLASLYAQKYPEHITALVLVAPAALIKSGPEFDIFPTMVEQLPEAKRPEFQRFKQEYFDMTGVISKSEEELIALNNRFGYYWMLAMDVPDNDNLISKLPSDPELAGGFMPYGIYFSFGKQWDFSKGLKKVTAPVLIIHGENDLQPLSFSKLYEDNFPNSQLEIIPGASHFPFIESPDEFNRIVAQFLESVTDNNS